LRDEENHKNLNQDGYFQLEQAHYCKIALCSFEVTSK